MEKLIGERIKTLRQKNGLTQAEIADKIGFTSQAISNWENGTREPDIEALIKMSSLFDVSLDYLLSGKEEDKISLDDMDEKKRLLWIIDRDDFKNFKKYDCLNSPYIFGRSIEDSSCGKLRVLIKETWIKIIKVNAKHIFRICCDEIIKMNTNKIWAAFLIYDFIDDFVKMTVDCDYPNVLETIGFRIFAVDDRPNTRNGNMPFVRCYEALHYINNIDTYFIKKDTFEYFFTNRLKSPKCYEYATTFDLKIDPLKNYCRGKEYTYTHLHNEIVKMSIKYGYYDTLDKVISTYKNELNNEDIKKNEYNSFRSFYSEHFINTYVLSDSFDSNKVIGRIFYFQKSAIDDLLNKKEFEYAKKLNSFNGEVIKKLKELNFENEKEFEKIFRYNDKEFERAEKLNSDLPELEKTYLLCIDDYILVPDEIKKIRDLKLVRDILNRGFLQLL